MIQTVSSNYCQVKFPPFDKINIDSIMHGEPAVKYKEYKTWVRVSDELEQKQFERLFAFRDPLTYGFPVVRVGKLDNKDNLIIIGAGYQEQNLGNYKNLGPVYCKDLPHLPEELWPRCYFNHN